MCGRIEYVVTNKTRLQDHYGVRFIEGYTAQGVINASYNIPPTAKTPILTSEDNEEICVGHWGFVPSWAKEGSKVREVINARAETMLEKPFFKKAALERRCLIPVTGFFEWHRVGTKKTPFRFFKNNEIFSLAGIYTVFKDKNGLELPHYAIITTTANEIMAPIHDRMPVIIDPSDEKSWVSDTLSEMDIIELLKPYPADLMSCYEISPLVNNVRNNSPEIIEPVRK